MVHNDRGDWIGYGLGDSGTQVTKIQHRLIFAYPKNSRAIELGVQESGIYDSATEEAVKNVQRLFSLTVDGWVGKQTWAKIDWLALR